jgi:bifunctional non-homologous end joining protein LigD
LHYRIAFRVQSMVATLVGKAFYEPGWVFEEKYDGIRVLAYKEGKRVSLRSRNDMDRTANFPEVVATIANLKPTTLLLDEVFDLGLVGSG